MDPTRLEIFKNIFHSVAEEMGAALRRSAFSPNIKERRDYSCAVYDADGQVLAMGDHMPVHLGSMVQLVPRAIRAYGSANLDPGDAIVELAGGAVRRLGLDVVPGQPIMGAEDFSFVLQRVPGAMLMLGVKNPSWTDSKPAHTAHFDLDEAALPLGAAAYAAMALEFLNS